jgi:hypothetical protein
MVEGQNKDHGNMHAIHRRASIPISRLKAHTYTHTPTKLTVSQSCRQGIGMKVLPYNTVRTDVASG